MNQISIGKDEVLRKIGRNVLALQKLEGMLKRLVTLQGAKLTVDDEHAVRQRLDTIAKRPLGHLVTSFLNSAYPATSSESPTAMSDASVKLSLSFSLDPKMEEEHTLSLSAIVRERNDLIHQMLIDFDPQSYASCEALSQRLDEQLERIKPEYEFLRLLLASIRKAIEDTRTHLSVDNTDRPE